MTDYYQPLSHTDPNAVPPPPPQSIAATNGSMNPPPPPPSHAAVGVPSNPPPPAGYATAPPPAPHAALPPSTTTLPTNGSSSYETMDYHTIIVEGLPQHVTDPDLRHFFSPYGSIDCIIITPRNPSSPPDPELTAGGDMEAMIKFLQRESALSVVNTLTGAEYYGFRLKIYYATAGQVEARRRAAAPTTAPPSQPAPSTPSAPLDYNAYLASATQSTTPTPDASAPSSYPASSSSSSRPMNIYLANVPTNWTRTELENFFGPRYGRILEGKVLPGRGVGFILFEKEEDGKRCLEESKGIVLDGAPGPLVARMTRLPPHMEQGAQGGGPAKRGNSYQGHRYNPMYGAGRGTTPYNNYGYPAATPQYPPAQYPPAAIPGADPYAAMYANPAAMQYPAAASQSYPAASPFGYPGAQQSAYGAYPGATAAPIYGTAPTGYPTPGMPPAGPAFAGGGRGRGRGRGRQAEEPYLGDPNREVALFVFHIPNSLNENAIRDLFGQYGRVVNVAINRDKATGEARGYGFVTMSNLEEARNCIQFLNGYHQDNKYLKVTLKQAK